MDVAKTIADVRDAIAKLQADPKARELLDRGEEFLRSGLTLVNAVRSGDDKAVEAKLAEWEDVAKTRRVTDALRAENASDEAHAVTVAKVLEVVEVVAKVAGIAASVAAVL